MKGEPRGSVEIPRKVMDAFWKREQVEVAVRGKPESFIAKMECPACGRRLRAKRMGNTVVTKHMDDGPPCEIPTYWMGDRLKGGAGR